MSLVGEVLKGKVTKEATTLRPMVFHFEIFLHLCLAAMRSSPLLLLP